jgi:UDP-N-acetylmuramate--alanine ligase
MRIYCSGIGGIGLSAYASYQKAEGHEVLGSDQNQNILIEGIDVSLNQDGSNVPEDADLFVYTLALPEDHPELEKAKELGIECKTYFEALGDLTKDYKLIAVCGTSGKSSTTAMAAKVLMDANLDPSVILGTKTKDLDGKNWRKGDSNIFLIEACEYCNSFHHLSPNIVLLTNAYGDHFDAYSGIEEYEASFKKFIEYIPSDGVLITHDDDSQCKKISKSASCKVVNADEKSVLDLSMQVPGRHMQQNAVLVISLAETLGIDLDASYRSVNSYQGCWRRMEFKGTTEIGAKVFDDYAHHPVEISETIVALHLAHKDRRLVCVFQPHTHDRTIKLYDQFLDAFKSADLVIIPNIYEARTDRDCEKVDVDKFVEDIKSGSSVEVINGKSLDNTVSILKNEVLKENDLLVTMGAGDVTNIGEELF